MDVKKKQSGKRTKKYKFRGNQHTRGKTDRLSASGKKLNMSSPVVKNTSFDGYCLIDKKTVFSSLENCTSCKACNGNIKITTSIVAGLSEKVSVTCTNCGPISSGRNSANVKKNSSELNTRFIYAMRCIGHGLAAARTFCSIMDLPPPLTLTAYNKTIHHIQSASRAVAESSMVAAAKDEMKLTGEGTDITISGDGTWKTRGHSSLLGVCTVIGLMTGKVIDSEVLSSRCKVCESYKGVRSGLKYDMWLLQHQENCERNHSGSAGMMEVVGMCRIFERSEEKRCVRYSRYIGDGDTKTFHAIQKLEPYGKNLTVSKIECVGHIQKRMSSRLRKRKEEMRGKKLADGKLLSGKGRLTNAVIDKFTVYYGNAIRKHSESYKSMQSAIWAIFFHTRSTDAEPQHNFCPEGPESWCPYRKAVAANTVGAYKHTSSLPPCVMDSIKDIFKDLSMPSLLKKCLGGHTQNANESINSIIWKFCPKTSSAGPNIVQIAVNEAIISFNEGQKGRLVTMEKLGLRVGPYVTDCALNSDLHRVNVAEKRKAACTLEARRAKRRSKKCAQDILELKEGQVYAPGEF